MTAEQVEIVRRGYKLLAAGDIDALAGLIDDRFELHPPVAGESAGVVYRGLAGLSDYLADLQSTWERFEQRPEELIDLGDNGVLAILRLEAKGRASGIELSQRVALHWTFEGGRARLGVGYSDVAEARRVVGLES